MSNFEVEFVYEKNASGRIIACGNNWHEPCVLQYAVCDVHDVQLFFDPSIRDDIASFEIPDIDLDLPWVPVAAKPQKRKAAENDNYVPRRSPRLVK
jgi:hypothetical protein